MKRLLASFLLLSSAAAAVGAQVPQTPPAGRTATVEVDPIRCWWRTSTAAVRIGESFDLALTCAVLENDDVQVVADESHLGSSVVAMAPFEVVGGTPVSELRSGQRRFFQYQYVLRIINPDAIGKDVTIPDMVIHYKVNSRIAANTALQGRDLVYLLPTQSIRVASVVPSDAKDIRDTTGESFGAVDGLTLRAGTLEIVAIASIALGSLMVILALVSLARRTGQRTPSDQRLLSMRTIVGGAQRELSSVQKEREQSGWTEGLVARALAAARIAGSAAIGRPVSQRVSASAAESAGRLNVAGPLGGKRRQLSSPVTPAELVRRASSVPPALAEAVDKLQRALAVFSQTQYARDTKLDDAALDAALADATDAARSVKADYSWLNTTVRRFTRGRAPVESRA